MATYPVRDRLDVYEPRRVIQVIAANVGFRRSDCYELAIVVSELASNIVKYGVTGSISFENVWDFHCGPGITIVAEDIGPPFHDLTMAIKDGFDDRGPINPGRLLQRGGIGAGLGAVIRLTDSFHVESLPQGKRVCTLRYLRRLRVHKTVP